MDDQRLDAAIRMLRRRRRWRLEDLAQAAGVSKSAAQRIERGHVVSSSVGHVRKVAAVLEIRVDLVPRWRGGELDRLLNGEHSRMGEAVARWLREIGGWEFAPEVSFAIYSERGVIDILAWHPGRQMLLIIELKTSIVDVQDLVGTMDRRKRLARRIASERGWSPKAVSCLVLVADERTNRRRVQEHAAILRAAFPSDGRRLSGFMRDPAEAASILAFWPSTHGRGPRSGSGGAHRVERSRGALPLHDHA